MPWRVSGSAAAASYSAAAARIFSISFGSSLLTMCRTCSRAEQQHAFNKNHVEQQMRPAGNALKDKAGYSTATTRDREGRKGAGGACLLLLLELLGHTAPAPHQAVRVCHRRLPRRRCLGCEPRGEMRHASTPDGLSKTRRQGARAGRCAFMASSSAYAPLVTTRRDAVSRAGCVRRDGSPKQR